LSCVIVNPLNAELNPIYHLLALLAHHIFHVSELRVNYVASFIGWFGRKWVVGGNGSELRPLAGYMGCAERSGYACGM
jgi:hypothetical protein